MNMPPVGTNPMGQRQSLDNAIRSGDAHRRQKVPESNVSLLSPNLRKFVDGPGRKLTFREKEIIRGIARDFGGDLKNLKLNEVHVYKGNDKFKDNGQAHSGQNGRVSIIMSAASYEKDYTDGKASSVRQQYAFTKGEIRSVTTSGGHIFAHEITHALQFQGVLFSNVNNGDDDYNYRPEIKNGFPPAALSFEDMAQYVADKYGHRFDGKPNPGSPRVAEPPQEELRRERYDNIRENRKNDRRNRSKN